MWLPDQHAVLPRSSDEDPARFYYLPLVKYFFLNRFRMILRALDKTPGLVRESVLDVGYGSGLLFPELSRRFQKLFGVDRHAFTETVASTLQAMNISVQLCSQDVCRLTFPPQPVDCLVCVSVLEHLPDVTQAVHRMIAVTKPGGVLIVGFPSKNRLTHYWLRLIGFDDTHHHASSHHQILSVLQTAPGIQLEHLMRFPAWLPEAFPHYWTFAKWPQTGV